MGGRGSGSGRAGGGGGNRPLTKSEERRWGKNPVLAPMRAKLSMGGYTYLKTGSNTWVTFGPDGKRVKNRTDADIKRVFT